MKPLKQLVPCDFSQHVHYEPFIELLKLQKVMAMFNSHKNNNMNTQQGS